MASMLPLPGDDKPVLAEVRQPEIAGDVFKRGDLQSTGDGMVALAQGLKAYGDAQTNREISSIKNQASIGQAVMGGLAQMAGKLKQNMQESGGSDNIAYQFNPDSGQMTAVGPGQPFSDAGSIFSGGAVGEDFLGGFFGDVGSGNPTAPTTREAGQAPVSAPEAAAGNGVSGPGTVAQATVVAGPAMHKTNMENDIWDIAQRNQDNPKNFLKESNEYLAKQYELSTSLGKGGKAAWEHAANFAGQTYRSVSQHYTTNKIKGDYNDSTHRMDRLENDIYTVARTYDNSKVGFDKWFSEDPRWKELNDIVAGVSTNPATNSDFGSERAGAYIDRVKDRAKTEYVIGHAAGLRDKEGYDAAYDWVRKNTIDDPSSSSTPEQKQSAYHAAINEINALNETQKAQRAAAIHTTNQTLHDLREGGFRVVPQSDILKMASAARKAYAPEAALALESFARLNNSKEVQSAFRLNHVKAFESLVGPGGQDVIKSTIRSNEGDVLHRAGVTQTPQFDPNANYGGAYKPGSIPLSGSAAQYGENYVFGNMKPDFRDRLAAMAAAAKAEGVPFSVHSGFRSQEHQDRLFANSDGSGHMVAKHSHHTAGDAADLSGDLNWAHRNASRFGLHFPMSWENWHIEMSGSRDQKSYDYAQGPVSSFSVANAIFGQESGWNPNIGTSVNGAKGIGQILPATFNQFAHPGENINNPADNARVANRMVDTFMKKYNGDAARVAVAYFSGEGNVAPMGYATPWKEDKHDGNGKSVSGYVSDVMGRLYKNRSGYGAHEGEYTPNLPTTDGLKPPSSLPMNSTFAGISSPIPFTQEQITQNPYLASDFVRRQVADLKTEAATLKAQLPGIEDNIRKGIEPDQQTLASIMQFSRAFPEMMPGIDDKLSAIAEASQHVWHTNGQDLTKWMADTDEMARTSPDIRTTMLANEAKKMSEAAMRLQQNDPWTYGVRSGAFKTQPIGWADAMNPAAFGAQNTAQVVATGMEQRRNAGEALFTRIGQGDPIEYAYPTKDLKALSDTLDNAPPEQVAQILGAMQGNIKTPNELARIMSNKDVVRSLFGLASSDDVGKALSANKFLEYAHDQSPYVFHGQFGGEAVAAVNKFMYDSRYSTAENAVKIQRENRDLNKKDMIYRAQNKIANNEVKEWTDKKVMNMLELKQMPDESAISYYMTRTSKMQPEMADAVNDREHGNMAAVSQLFKERYISAFSQGATKEGALKVARDYVNDTFKRSSFSGGKLMWNAPELVYKDPSQLQQFTQELNTFLYKNATGQGITLDSGAMFTPQMAVSTQAGGKAALISDKQTADERVALQSPSYLVQVRDANNQLHILVGPDKKPLRFGLKGRINPPPMGP